MAEIIPFSTQSGGPLYEAQVFAVETECGEFQASGTLCGHIDLVGPFDGCLVLSPDEAHGLIAMLQAARADVLANSRPSDDPRLIGRITKD